MKRVVRWHKAADGGWYGEVDGVTLAVAANTSATGTEDYPWDWYYTDEGERLRIADRVGRARSQGVHATLRDVKRMVDFQIGVTES